MAFSEAELVFLTFIFIYALGFLMSLLGKINNTSTEQEGILYTHASIWAVEGPQRHFL